MRSVDFSLLDKSSRIVEFKNSKDIDIIIYTLQRATGLEYETLKNIEIEYSFIRHKIVFRTKPELLIRILDDLYKLKLEPLIKNNEELIYDIDLFFNKIN